MTSRAYPLTLSTAEAGRFPVGSWITVAEFWAVSNQPLDTACSHIPARCKGVQIAKTIVLSKIESRNVVLRKFGLEQHDLMTFKAKIENIESVNIKDVGKRLPPLRAKLQNSISIKSFSYCLKT